VREREAKLGAGPAFDLPDLEGVIDGLTATAFPQRHLDAVYYDTHDLRLARWGITVRHRTGEDDGWTVKLPEDGGGEATLVRNELAFPGARAAGPPPPVADLVRAHVRTSTLAPVARLRTRRTPVELRDEQGRRLAEVVDDEVSVFEGRRVAARFREVEVELDEDAPAGSISSSGGRGASGPCWSTSWGVQSRWWASIGPPPPRFLV
jgi:inorganic triphosphatase YgiF